MLKLHDICIEHNKTLMDALKLIDKNGQGIVFVQKDKIFYGTLTDGDIRRALIAGAKNSDNVESFCNKSAVSMPVFSSDSELLKAFLSNEISMIPLVNDQGIVIDFASKSRLHRFPVMEPTLKGKEKEYVNDCIDSNWISSQGSYVDKFQDELATISGSNYVLGTSSGTTALHLALETLGIGKGDEVIAPNLTFGASINSIIHSGATPVLVDINQSDWNISPEKIIAAITPKTKAIMVVHLYGNPCKMNEILKIANNKGLLVIEDCAESIGATINERPVGSFGDASAFSFFANKVITCGEGGAVTFKDKAHFSKAKMLRDHGMNENKRYWHEVVGYNYRMTNIQAAIGCAQIEQLSSFTKKRSEIWEKYNKQLLKSNLFTQQKINDNNNQCLWLYTLLINNELDINRDELIEELRLLGIDSRPIFYPMSLMPAFIDNAKIDNNLDVSIDISSRGISFPSSISLKDEEIRWISEKIILSTQKLLQGIN